MKALTLAVALTIASAALAEEPPASAPEPKHTVAVLEYRAGARGARDVGLRLARLLRETAAVNVIDIEEARRKVPRVDAEVARCGGQARCIGNIGQELGAQEVLLVGVSQLGDVIIALQRIDAQRGEAGARLAESLPPDSDVTDEQGLNWLKQLFPPEVFRRYGTIAVEADQTGANIQLNNEVEGKTGANEPIKVRAPGTYKLRVEKRGYVPFEARVDVLPDANIVVRATLVKETKEVPWYKRWYPWVIVGGAVAIAAVATAIYFGTRVDPTPLGYVQKPAPMSLGLTVRW
jgi:hypothetical protein